MLAAAVCLLPPQAGRGVSKRIIPQLSRLSQGNPSGFYSNVTASLHDFYGSFMTSLSPSVILLSVKADEAIERGRSRDPCAGVLLLTTVPEDAMYEVRPAASRRARSATHTPSSNSMRRKYRRISVPTYPISMVWRWETALCARRILGVAMVVLPLHCSVASACLLSVCDSPLWNPMMSTGLRQSSNFNPTAPNRRRCGRPYPRTCIPASTVCMANHVLDHAPDFHGTLVVLLGALASSGLLLAAMAGRANRHGPASPGSALTCLASRFLSIPPKTVRPLGEAGSSLRQGGGCPLRAGLSKYEVNRLRLGRFLLGGDFHAVPRPALLQCFALYAHAGQISPCNSCTSTSLCSVASRGGDCRAPA